MPGKKVKLAFITNDSERKSTFNRRKKGLVKKASELSTLCGIDACVIIHGPYESQPEVWPNNLGVQRVLAKFTRMPEMKQGKKVITQEIFIRQSIAKANEQLKKQLKLNREKEMTEIMYQCLSGRGLQNLSMVDQYDLNQLIDQNLKEIGKKIESLKKTPQQVAPVALKKTKEMPGNGMHRKEEKLLGVDLPMDAMKRSHGFNEWMNNPLYENMGFGGDGMMVPFGDNNNVMWSSFFFP
ncbi:Agamous-like MADS-box protein AGL80 [Camellia lanceoleosa]|uniref:Agamous-like MADS-box protein AGL80 n=1 Tax=Camellia lanceoleosa TaxID=1840588 RepID=A0ACC0IPR1_9ERIC|nr:Agamous-like MADS-box protein AGL80 [Camellia lanceoleosa]